MSQEGQEMVAFRIRYRRWDPDSEHSQSKGPVFHVYTGATEPPLVIQVLVAASDFRILQQEIAVQQETRVVP